MIDTTIIHEKLSYDRRYKRGQQLDHTSLAWDRQGLNMLIIVQSFPLHFVTEVKNTTYKPTVKINWKVLVISGRF